jgi:putative FmdB family regulatory protein
MPIYEYKCTKGHVFEVQQSFTDDALTKCQICGAPVQKVFHPVSVHFKGSGFYNTDYGTKRRAREKAAESSKDSSSSSSTSSESSKGSGSSDSSSSNGTKSDSTSADKKPSTAPAS